MLARILSRVVDRVLTIAALFTAASCVCNIANAQSGNGLVHDPATGIIYRPIVKTVERPVVETKVETREQTVYRPQTVTESKPEARTIYTPVVEHQWEPRLHGRWNPFRQPTLAYHHVPNTRWEARQEVVQRTNSRTEWIAEKRSIDVPQQVVRMEREQKVDYEVVGLAAPPASESNLPSAIASRLQPLPVNARIEPMSQPRFAQQTQIAASAGRLTSDPPARTNQQGGMRATELYPGAMHGQALPPVNGGSGIATMPSLLPFFR
jgi:hypothetical protein